MLGNRKKWRNAREYYPEVSCTNDIKQINLKTKEKWCLNVKDRQWRCLTVIKSSVQQEDRTIAGIWDENPEAREMAQLWRAHAGLSEKLSSASTTPVAAHNCYLQFLGFKIPLTCAPWCTNAKGVQKKVFNTCRKNRIEKRNNKFNDQRHLISDRSLLRQEKCHYHSKTTLPLRGLFPTLAVKILLWCTGTVQESATDSTRKQVSQMNTLDHMIRALRIQWN